MSDNFYVFCLDFFELARRVAIFVTTKLIAKHVRKIESDFIWCDSNYNVLKIYVLKYI